MKKLKIKVLDKEFVHCGYMCNPLPPTSPSKHIEWDRNVSDSEDAVIYTDKMIPHPRTGHRKRIAWLTEPYGNQPHIYKWISENSHLYDYILTNEKDLLDQGEKFIFIPSGGSWVEEENRKFHDKPKLVSIICSKKNRVPGHQKRHDLISQFGHLIDVMGRGYAPIPSITEGLKDYAFHIAMENQRRDLHFSEKLINPFCTGTIPIYWGMPSIGDYFDTRGMIIMNDISEFPDIYNSLGEELYISMLPYARENFKRAQEYISIEDWVYNAGVFAKMGIVHE